MVVVIFQSPWKDILKLPALYKKQFLRMASQLVLCNKSSDMSGSTAASSDEKYEMQLKAPEMQK